ncbi:MAG: acyltransferase [Acidimicrobiales bacterium]|nr:acyltransferase [Acidimicrobiales bacterium]
MTQRLRYVPQLDGLRALAAGVVVLHHIPMQVGVGGYIGVDVFFVLSGFLITKILRSEVLETGAVSLREFYARRLRRLTPALILLALVVVQAYLVIGVAPDKDETALGGLLAVTYAGSWAKAFGVSTLGWLAHTWSLSVEEHFYLFWPLLVRRFAKKSVDALLVATGSLFALSSALWVTGVARGWSIERLAFAPDTRAKDILAGCILALVLERGLAAKRPPAWTGAASLTLLAAWAVFVPQESALYRVGWPIVLMAAAVAAWSLVSNDTSRVSRALANRRLVWVGKRSYGIYLWHYPLTILNSAVVSSPGPVRLGVAVATTSTAVALAAWSYRFVEQPLRDQAYGRLTLDPVRDYVHHMLRRRRSIRISSAGNTSGSSIPSPLRSRSENPWPSGHRTSDGLRHGSRIPGGRRPQ